MKTSPRRVSLASVKRSLLAGAAVASLCAGAATAQTTGVVQPETAPVEGQARGPDGLAPGSLYMEADSMVRDDSRERTTATGEVEARYDSRNLRADALVYDEAQGVLEASNVEIFNPDGSVEFAREIVLDDQMKAGIARGFAARLPMNVKLAAASAVRRNENVNELNRAIYTPCDICADNTDKTPTWSIQAEKVVQDEELRAILDRKAVFKVGESEACAAGRFVHVFVDRTTNQPTPIPAGLRHALECLVV